jgi:hypothetical protein
MSLDSSVGTDTYYGWTAGIPFLTGIFLFSIASRPALTPPALQSNGYRGAPSSRVERSRREADHSPPSSAKVKIGEAVPPLPDASSWSGTSLIKHRNNFTFTLIISTL